MPDTPAAPAALPLGALSFTLALVALAGYVDAVGYLRFQGVFVSFMSGNTTSLGVAVAEENTSKLLELAGVIGLFVVGVVGGVTGGTVECDARNRERGAAFPSRARKESLEIAEPPVAATPLYVGEPAGKRVQRGDHQRPHQVDDAQRVAPVSIHGPSRIDEEVRQQVGGESRRDGHEHCRAVRHIYM